MASFVEAPSIERIGSARIIALSPSHVRLALSHEDHVRLVNNCCSCFLRPRQFCVGSRGVRLCGVLLVSEVRLSNGPRLKHVQIKLNPIRNQRSREDQPKEEDDDFFEVPGDPVEVRIKVAPGWLSSRRISHETTPLDFR